jgi:mono/diheme cytochrome c family protein
MGLCHWEKAMKTCQSVVAVCLCAFVCVPLAKAQTADAKPGPDRGREAVRGRPPLNPAIASLAAFDRIWTRWGMSEKPAAFADGLRDRYGLYAAPYENGGLPMGLHVTKSFLGKGVGGDCLLCHAGRVAGQTIIGLGNASLDLQGLYEDLFAAQALSVPGPVRFSNARGTIEATAVVTFLMELRDADLNLKAPGKMDVKDDLCEDVPAWWHVRRKKTMYHHGGGHARSVRTMMPFLLSPFNSADYIKKQEPVFADIQAYLLTIEPPKYPFPIDHKLADRGLELFQKSCAKCHGSYGPDGVYPNKVVPLDVIGTDRRLAEGTSTEVAAHYFKSWFARETGPDGKPFPPQTVHGYQAPPLDGVWASAPYFHNGSAPTIYHVLNSKARPAVFTRSYRTEKEDYDADKVGWRITVLDQPPDPKLSGAERRKIYDTTQPGRGNGGHTFGDSLTEEERRAVIEYLKTL